MLYKTTWEGTIGLNCTQYPLALHLYFHRKKINFSLGSVRECYPLPNLMNTLFNAPLQLCKHIREKHFIQSLVELGEDVTNSIQCVITGGCHPLWFLEKKRWIFESNLCSEMTIPIARTSFSGNNISTPSVPLTQNHYLQKQPCEQMFTEEDVQYHDSHTQNSMTGEGLVVSMLPRLLRHCESWGTRW